MCIGSIALLKREERELLNFEFEMDEKKIQEIKSHICGKLYRYSGPFIGNSQQRG